MITRFYNLKLIILKIPLVKNGSVDSDQIYGYMKKEAEGAAKLSSRVAVGLCMLCPSN